MKELLEKNGWLMVCESPLELEHTDGGFASGVAAKMVIKLLKIKEQPSFLNSFQLNDILSKELREYGGAMRLDSLIVRAMEIAASKTLTINGF